MITREHALLVQQDMREYPAGIPSGAWGSGPMASPGASHLADYRRPGEFGPNTLLKCG